MRDRRPPQPWGLLWVTNVGQALPPANPWIFIGVDFLTGIQT
jgi:hypothetical protein